MIVKIKRLLSRIGIGDTLAQLFYSSKEMERMRKCGKLLTPEQALQNSKMKPKYQPPRPEKKYLIGFEPNVLYSTDDQFGNVRYVELLSKEEAYKEANLRKDLEVFEVEVKKV